VHDLEERRALVAGAATAARIARDLDVVGQVVRRLRVGEAVDAVGDDADDDARARNAAAAQHVRARRAVALGRDGAGTHDGRIDGPYGAHPGEAGEAVERVRLDPRLHAAGVHLGALDRHAGLDQRRELRRSERRAVEVDVPPAVCAGRGRRRDETAGERARRQRIAEPRADLAADRAQVPRGADVAQLAEDALEIGRRLGVRAAGDGGAKGQRDRNDGPSVSHGSLLGRDRCWPPSIGVGATVLRTRFGAGCGTVVVG
jgi:hypothetical protein